MEEAPLPTTITPKEEISESFEIKKDKYNYKLNIKIVEQDITLNLINQKEIMKDYKKKLSLDELKKMHRVFFALNSCKEFVDYLKAIIENNKLSIRGFDENKIYIELNVEYLFKQNTIMIDLIKKKLNFKLMIQDLYTKYSFLEENYKNILQENENIKEENNNIKNEMVKLKDENKEQKEKIINLEKDINLCKELLFKNKENIKENKKIKIQDNIDDLERINKENEEGNIIKNKIEELENKQKKEIIIDKEIKKENEIEKKEIFEFKGRTLFELLESKLIKIFSENSPNIDKNDTNELKKICWSIFMYKMEPLDKIREILMKNFDKFQNELDENAKINIAIKKGKVFDLLQHIGLSKKIKAKNDEQFIELFREKYGITKKDYCDKSLKELIKTYKNEIDLLKLILKELKYLK